MCIADRKHQIKNTLLNNDKTIKWLDQKLPGVDVYYLLSDAAKSFDVEIYDQIISIFKKEGFITSENDKCTKLLSQIVHVDAVLGHSLELLNSNVYEFTKDNVLDFSEKMMLTKSLDKIEQEFTNELDRVRRIIHGQCNG